MLDGYAKFISVSTIILKKLSNTIFNYLWKRYLLKMQFLIPQQCINSSEICLTDFSQKKNFGKSLFKKLEERVMVRA